MGVLLLVVLGQRGAMEPQTPEAVVAEAEQQAAQAAQAS